MSIARVADLTVASRSGLVTAFAGLARELRRGSWLPKSHPLYRDHLSVLRDATDPPFAAIPETALVTLIACAGPSHCVDAWRYFSRAVEALVRQDVRAAQHFAYYSELRAATSLLAASGIGVFRDRHFVVDENGKCYQLFLTARSEGTHTFVWRAFSEWTETAQALYDTTKMISAFGYNLGEWIGAPQYGSAAKDYVGKVLRRWGLDLKKFNDKDTRNKASYGPSCVMGPSLPALKLIRSFLADAWKVLQPVNSIGNWRLDDFLIREALLSHIGAVKVTAQDRRTAVRSYCAAKGLTVGTSHRQFLTRRSSRSTPSILTLSAKHSPSELPNNILEMLSRALLLLRLATGVSNSLFKEAGFSSDTVDEWRDRLGKAFGLWDDSTAPFDYQDLWVDGYDAAIDPALIVVRRDTRSAWLSRADGAPPALTQFERVPVWSIG